METRQKQRCIIEFLHMEGNAPINIHRHLQKVYKADAVDVSTVRRWVRRFESGESDVKDKARSGRPHTAATPENEARLDGLIRADRRITLNEMREELGVGVSAVETMLSSLGYSKVCASNRRRYFWNDPKGKSMAEDTPVESPKRKRGRPPKPESEKAAAKRKSTETDGATTPKRGRGRPKGSKNKSTKKAPPTKGTGRRGRPPKNPPKEDASEESAEDAE